MNPELRQWVTNIPRNGDWSKDENLAKYLQAADMMSVFGMNDQSIIKILTFLFKAAGEEKEYLNQKDSP